MLGNVPQIDNELQTIVFDYVKALGKEIIIAHCDVHKWTKETKPVILKQIKELASKQTLPIFVVHDGKDKKHLKWITMCGFVFSGFSTNDYGEEEYMYIWSNK
jgi:hypothetical protein